jgi:hypothetical protein
MPNWLMADYRENEPLPIGEILDGSVFYPASGMDGRPVKYLGGFSHSFGYADCNVTCDALKRDIDTFKGYRIRCLRAVKKEELCFKPFRPVLPQSNDGNPRRLHVCPGFVPYALWAIYERHPHFDEVHGPQRFSLLFVGGEGAAAFQALYYSNQCTPSCITLSRCDAFTDNWTAFFNPTRILARSVMQNPHGTPEYIFVDFRPDAEPPWPWYSELLHTIAVPHGHLRLWRRGQAASDLL